MKPLGGTVPLIEDILPEDVRAIGEGLRAAGHAVWLVGGCLRDPLAGRAPRDWDIATAAPAEFLGKQFDRVRKIGARGVTYLVSAAPGSPTREVSLLGGRTIEADLARRDFTINAIALSFPITNRNSPIDPAGGRADLAAGVLRAVGEPGARFVEDPLRPLRGVRLEQELGLTPEAGTLEAMAYHARAVATAAPERVREELLRCLACTKPSRAIERMRETGMLAPLLPEIAAMLGVAQPRRFHKLDVYRHTLAALDFAAQTPGSDAYFRFAVLYHDAGKPPSLTTRHGEPSFIGHEIEGARLTTRRCEALRFPKREIERVTALVRQHLVRYTTRWSDRALRRFMRRVTPALIPDLLALYAADVRAKDPERHRDKSLPDEVAALAARIDALQEAGAAITVRDLAITGDDVMRALGVPKGPVVGAALDALLERVLEDPALNEHDRLIALLADLEAGGSGGKC